LIDDKIFMEDFGSFERDTIPQALLAHFVPRPAGAESGAFAFAPFPSYEDKGFLRSPGAVKGARMRVHRSEAKTLDGEDGRVSWLARERGVRL